jgi:hypothetical protein
MLDTGGPHLERAGGCQRGDILLITDPGFVEVGYRLGGVFARGAQFELSPSPGSLIVLEPMHDLTGIYVESVLRHAISPFSTVFERERTQP